MKDRIRTRDTSPSLSTSVEASKVPINAMFIGVASVSAQRQHRSGTGTRVTTPERRRTPWRDCPLRSVTLDSPPAGLRLAPRGPSPDPDTWGGDSDPVAQDRLARGAHGTPQRRER